ncbi:hypothetical protein [Thiothrix nivea]|uniref:Transmembrane protein n=1 Tax=Thiothrix nivea (strain ATCC 35100 / DSM 5205 / JP2) TaxID=870187 RepID=A0A656HJT7_THINJ|nr:hypothetical protein [Thiothrix nivea]EIJ35285.1 hypothetical protein Thini_2748 [Thiothrix nivea DSM 5205]
MEDWKNLLIGIIGGLVVLGISKVYNAYRKKSIKSDIEFLEFEKKHLEEMKRSSVEMNRSSFRAIFAIFMFIGLANLIPHLFSLTGISVFVMAGSFLEVFLWGCVIWLSIGFWRRYDNLKNYKEAVERMDEKLVKLQEKLQGSK